MKRLLIIGKRGGILHWYEDALLAAGNDATGFSLNHHNMLARLAGHAMGKNHARVRRMIRDGLAQAIRQHQPELILIVDLFYLEPAINQLLIESGIATAQWIGDRFEDRLARNTGIKDFYFTDTGLIPLAERIGLSGRYLPLAATLPDRALPAWETRSNEILFIGAPSEGRVALIEQIRHPLLVIGPGWPTLRNPEVRIINHRISIKKTRRLYTQHKFVLNIMNESNVVNGLPQRCFDATMHGACLLMNSTPDTSLNFEEGKEIFIFRAPSDIAQITHDDTAASIIATRGREKSERAHTFRMRIAQFIAGSGNNVAEHSPS